jgi:cell division septum initiation protein DivIVA
MSIKEQEAPEFAPAFRGYDREQVDGYVDWLRNEAIRAEDRAGHAETTLAQCRRELAASPTTAGISERLAAMLQLATEEAEDIRARARSDSEAAIAKAESRAKWTIDEANKLRDAIQREIDDLSAIREQLLQRLIELGGDVVGATERFRGYPPGQSPVGVSASTSEATLYDAEADDGVELEPEAELDLVADETEPISEG